MNELLRRAMYGANLTETELAAELGVDPKTVRNWMRDQVPHARHRAALTRLLGVDEEAAWPELTGARQSDLVAVYPRRTAITHEVWLSTFEAAVTDIGILGGDVMFLVEDDGFVRLLGEKCDAGVRIKIGLWSPGALGAAADGLYDNAAVARAAVSRLQPLQRYDGFELRLHGVRLYQSMYLADDDLLVNQYGYGTTEAECPVFHYRRGGDGDMYLSYLTTFEGIWSEAEPLESIRPAR